MNTLLEWIDEGEQRKQEGMQRVGAANQEWVHHALEVLLVTARHKTFLTAEDVWERVSFLPDNNAAMGCVFKRACKMQAITKTNTDMPSTRPQAHKRPLRVWQSLIVKVY